MFLVLGQIELADLFLHVLVERLLPELQISPHCMILNTSVRKLQHTRTQFLKANNKLL